MNSDNSQIFNECLQTAKRLLVMKKGDPSKNSNYNYTGFEYKDYKKLDADVSELVNIVIENSDLFTAEQLQTINLMLESLHGASVAGIGKEEPENEQESAPVVYDEVKNTSNTTEIENEKFTRLMFMQRTLELGKFLEGKGVGLEKRNYIIAQQMHKEGYIDKDTLDKYQKEYFPNLDEAALIKNAQEGIAERKAKEQGLPVAKSPDYTQGNDLRNPTVKPQLTESMGI